MDEQTLNLLRRISRYVFIGVAVLLVLLLLLALFRVSIGFWLWSTVETWATVRLGLDSDATQLVTTILVSVITLLLPTLAWYFLWGKKQLWATGAVVGGQILIFLLVSTIGSGVCFDRNTGEPLCWYADIPGKGRVFSRTKGFDPVTGEEYKQYTREVARSSITVTKTAPSVEPAKPTSNSSSSKESKTVTVSAQKMWTETGVQVKSGDYIKIEASGQANASGVSTDAAYKWVSPDGWGYAPKFNAGNTRQPMRWVFVLGSDSSLGCLTGKIGRNGKPFKVGSSYSSGIQENGMLYLGFNDNISDWQGNIIHSLDEEGVVWSDNGGSFTATITK